ncbi:MAG: AAA family ATPase [Patescibacteria group bacterium]
MGYVAELAAGVRAEMAKVIVGQDEAVESLLIGLLAEGHLLLEGVPGVAKTLMVKALAGIVGADFKRVQFTPDLMPADVIGTNIFDLHAGEFRLRKGPIFTDLLLADEINRTPPKTQAALLEAMEERQVTIDGELHPLGDLFTVIATQNPVEYEGTYPLPEAELDRFMFKVLIQYPGVEEEEDLLRRHQRGFRPRDLATAGLARIADREAIARCRAELRAVVVEDGIIGYLNQIVRTTRAWPHVALGGSPRAAVNLLLAAKGAAAVAGRQFVVPDDVQRMAYPVLRHRLILRPEAEIEGLRADDAIKSIIAEIKVPR